jgi:aminomuconate-semialdehyde/2-hydroxymuconate-6-semialdehyde dehydrogenase
MEKIKNYIDGEFSETTDTLDNFNPATGEVYSSLPKSGPMEAIKAVVSAKKAFTKWSATSLEDRAAWLHKIADKIEERIDEFALAESTDVGKPLWLAKQMDIGRSIHNFRFFATEIIHKKERATSMADGSINYELRQPVGVAALITPWNLPLYLLSWKIAPALATGNTVVCKPSEITPMTAYLLSQVMHEIGMPKGVCNFVYGTGPDVGESLVTHPAVSLVSFTGGTATGAKIAAQSAAQFKKLSLELGGKNANIIFKDADLDKAVETSLKSSFLNQGEICLCGSRIFVQEDIFEEFKTKFVQKTKELIVGDPSDKMSFMGPLVSKEHFEKVKECVELAKKDKGVVLAGDEELNLPEHLKNGYYMRPTIIDELSDCSDLQQKEIFGPVVTLRPFKYPKDAVKWANTTPYGLSASIWTNDLKRAHKIAAQLDVGTVWVNTWLKRDLRMPFGGVKESGLGREGGEDSIKFFTESKTVCISLT